MVDRTALLAGESVRRCEGEGGAARHCARCNAGAFTVHEWSLTGGAADGIEWTDGWTEGARSDCASVTLADGIKLLSSMQLTPGNRSSTVILRIGVDASQLAGADKNGHVLLYTPNPYSGGSVSHWDTSARRNLLMEPAINADLTQCVYPPYDLTLLMFKDIGW